MGVNPKTKMGETPPTIRIHTLAFVTNVVLP
jgi:hypothetical protein